MVESLFERPPGWTPIPWTHIVQYAFVNKVGKWDDDKDFCNTIEEINLAVFRFKADAEKRKLRKDQFEIAVFQRVIM